MDWCQDEMEAPERVVLCLDGAVSFRMGRD